jgi:hypothetical protein
MQKQIDMKQIVEEFFKSVWNYVEKISSLYVDEADKQRLSLAKEKLKDLETEIKKLPNTSDVKIRFVIADGIEYIRYMDYMLFMKPRSSNNAALFAFNSVISELITYYKYPYVPEEKVLSALRGWYYHISDSVFKDFTYPFLPLSYFANKKVK